MHTPSFVQLACALFLSIPILATSGAHASTPGAEFPCNQTTAGNQAALGITAVAMDGSGNFVVVWESDQSTTADVYARRFDQDGNPLGGEFLVNTTTLGAQEYPAVAMNAAGQFVIVWESPDANGTGIRARIFNANGTAATVNDFAVNFYEANNQYAPAVGMDSSGNCVCAWQSDYYDPDAQTLDSDIYCRRFNSSGLLQADDTWVNSVMYILDQVTPAVAMGAGGNFVIVWSGPKWQNYGEEIFCRGFNSAGQETFSEGVANSYIAGDQFLPSVAMDGGGNFTVVWTSFEDNAGTDYGIYAQRFSSTAALIGGEFRINTTLAGNQAYPQMAMDSAGNFTVLWHGPDASGLGIFGQSFNSSAVAFGGEFAVNTTTASDQFIPSCAVNGAGLGVCVWSSLSQDAAGTYGVYGRRLAQLDLVAWWKLDDGSGTTAADSSGNGNTGTLNGGATWTISGRVNGALNLNGTTGYVSLPANPILNITSDITMAAWIKTSSTGLSILVGGYSGAGSFPGYGLAVNYPGTGKIAYWSGNVAWVSSASSNYSDGTWHHIAVSVTSTTATFYRDGVADGSPSAARPTFWSGAKALGVFPGGPSLFYSGSLDDMRIYNRALNASEIAVLVGLGRGQKGDFDGDGRSDILFRDPSSGDTVLWLMR